MLYTLKEVHSSVVDTPLRIIHTSIINVNNITLSTFQTIKHSTASHRDSGLVSNVQFAAVNTNLYAAIIILLWPLSHLGGWYR
jgi:hypothetical protein